MTANDPFRPASAAGASRHAAPDIRLEPWDSGDLDLLARCVADPAMMVHLGGPEAPVKIAERQARYERPGSNQYRIVDVATGARVGWVGFWEREWGGDPIYETGWAVVPEFQRRGIARAATGALLGIARSQADRRFVHAYPAIDNEPSNAVCRGLGFELVGAYEFMYPRGGLMRCNDWRLDLG